MAERTQTGGWSVGLSISTVSVCLSDCLSSCPSIYLFMCIYATPPSGSQRPDLRTCLTHVSLALHLPREMHNCRSSSTTPANVFGCSTKPSRLPHKTMLQRPKMVRADHAFNMFTSTRASRNNGMHFLDISTSKNAPKLVCFVHFDFDMCFGPQRCALF